MAEFSPPYYAIWILVLICLLSEFASGRPLRPPYPQFDNRDDRSRPFSSNYGLSVADKECKPFARTPFYNSKNRLSSSYNLPSRQPVELFPKDKTSIPVCSNSSEPFVVLSSGENVPYTVYESCVNCYDQRLPVTVITACGDIVPVSSFREVVLVTKGNPEDHVRLPNGVIVSAGAYCGLISGYIDDTLEVQYPRENENQSEEAIVEDTKVLEPTVILPTGEQIPYDVYECIVINNEERTPLLVSTPKGEKVFHGLTELILVTQGSPYDLVLINNGTAVTTKVFRDVINSRYKKNAVLVLPSGVTLPLTSEELIPSDKLPTEETSNADSVVVLPNGEEISQSVYDSIVDSEIKKTPKNVIKVSGEVVTVTTLPQIIKVTRGCPYDVIELENGVVITPSVYESAVNLSAEDVIAPEVGLEPNAKTNPQREVSVVIYGGLELPYEVYEAILETFYQKKPFSVTVSGNTVPVSSLLDLIVVTQGQPNDVITLPNGMHVKSTTFRGVINEHQQNDIFLRIPSGEIIPLSKGKDFIPPKRECQCLSPKEGSVTVTSGEKVQFPLYEHIICSSIDRKPVNVVSPDGSIYIAETLPELLELTDEHPDYLIKLPGETFVTGDTYRNVVNSRQENADTIKRLCGYEGKDVPPPSSSDSLAVVILPSKDRIPYHLYKSIIDSYERRNLLKTTTGTSQTKYVFVYPLVELMLMTKYRPNALVYLENGDITTARTYRDVVIAHTQGGAVLLHPSGRTYPLGASTHHSVPTEPEESEAHTPNDRCRFVRITVPGRGVQFILGDGSWDSPRFCRIECGGKKVRYEPADPSRGLPCYESLIRPDGKVVYVETSCSRSTQPTSTVTDVKTIFAPNTVASGDSDKLHSVDVENDPVDIPCSEESQPSPEVEILVEPKESPICESRQNDSSGKLHPVDVGDNPVELFEPPEIAIFEEPPCSEESEPTLLLDVPEENRPCPEVEVELEPEPEQVVFIDQNDDLHSIDVPEEIQPCLVPDAEQEPESNVLVDRTSKLHILDIPEAPCEYQSEEISPICEPGKIDSSGELHSIDVKDNPVKLFEPSEFATFEEPPCLGEPEPTLILIDVPEENRPCPEVEVELEPEPEQVVFIDQNDDLHSIDVPEEIQPCLVPDAEQEPESNVFDDGTSKLHILDIPEAPCEYQSEEISPICEPGNIDSSGELHSTDVGDNPAKVFEPSEFATFEEPPCLEEPEPTLILVDVPEKNRPCPEVEVELEPEPEQVVFIDQNDDLHSIDVPEEIQPWLVPDAEQEPESNVFDGGTSKLHILDIPEAPCEYQSEEISPICEPGKIDSSGELHSIDVKDNPVKLFEPSEFATFEEPPCLEEPEPTLILVDVPEENRPCPEDEVELTPEIEQVVVTDQNADLHNIADLELGQPCPDFDVVPEPENVKVIDGTGKLHTFEIPEPPCEYQPEGTFLTEPGKVVVIDSSGQLHTVDVGDDPVTLIEPSGIATFEEPFCLDITEPIQLPVDLPDETLPCPEAEIVVVPEPGEIQVCPAHDVVPEPENVKVIDGTGKLHTLDIPEPPCEYKPEETSVTEPGKVVVIDSSGQLHTVDVGDDPVTLFEPSGITTFEEPPSLDKAEPIPSPTDIPEETQPCPVAEVVFGPKPGEIQVCPAHDVVPEPENVKVIDGTGKLHILDIPEPPCKYQPEETPIAEPGKVVVIDSSGQLHMVDVGDGPVSLFEPSEITILEEPPCLDNAEPIPPPVDISEETQPCPEVEVVAGLKPGEIQPCPGEDGVPEPENVKVIDETGKLQNLNIPEPPCEYQPEESPIAEPGKVVVIDSSGQLHTVDVGDDLVTLYEPSSIVTLDEGTSLEGDKPICSSNFDGSPNPENEGVVLGIDGNENIDMVQTNYNDKDPCIDEDDVPAVIISEPSPVESPDVTVFPGGIASEPPLAESPITCEQVVVQPEVTITDLAECPEINNPSPITDPSPDSSLETESSKEIPDLSPAADASEENPNSSPGTEHPEENSVPTPATENIDVLTSSPPNPVTKNASNGIESAAMPIPEDNSSLTTEPNPEVNIQDPEMAIDSSPLTEDNEWPTTASVHATLEGEQSGTVVVEYPATLPVDEGSSIPTIDATLEGDEQLSTTVAGNPAVPEEGSTIATVEATLFVGNEQSETETVPHETYAESIFESPPMESTPVLETYPEIEAPQLPGNEALAAEILPETSCLNPSTIDDTPSEHTTDTKDALPPKPPECPDEIPILEGPSSNSEYVPGDMPSTAEITEPSKDDSDFNKEVVVVKLPIPYSASKFPPHSPWFSECPCAKPYYISLHGDGIYAQENFHDQRSPKKESSKKKSKKKKNKPSVSSIENLPEVHPSYTPIYDNNDELLYFVRSDLLTRHDNVSPDLISTLEPSGPDHEPKIVPSKPNKVLHDDDGNMFVLPVSADGSIAFNTDSSHLKEVPEENSDDEAPTPFTFPETEDRQPPSSDPDYIIVRSPDGYINYIPSQVAPGRDFILPSGAKHVLPVYPSKFIHPSVRYHTFTTPDGIVYEVPYGRGHSHDIETSIISIEKIETPEGKTFEIPVETKKRSDGSITTSVTYTPEGKTKYKTIVDVSGDVYCIPISGSTIHHHPNSHIYKTIIDPEGDEYHVAEGQLKSSSYKTITDIDGNIYEIPAITEPVDNLKRAQYRTTTLPESTKPNNPNADIVVKPKPEIQTIPYFNPGENIAPYYYHKPYHPHYYDPVMAHFYHDRVLSLEQHPPPTMPNNYPPHPLIHNYHYPIQP